MTAPSTASTTADATAGTTLARWSTFAVAIFLLNLSVTFENRWPTPAIRWQGEVSIEFAIVVLALWLLWRGRGRLSRAAVTTIGAFWLALVVGRYADVTAPALYGRDINLYWDVRYVSDVAAMLTHAASFGLVGLVGAGAALVVAILFFFVRWAVARVARALDQADERRVLVWAAAILAVLFAAQTAAPGVPAVPQSPRLRFPLAVRSRADCRAEISARTPSRGGPADGSVVPCFPRKCARGNRNCASLQTTPS
jgi:hypothetical protein